eukprot:c53772_g1_i1.p1 GENE.c53772_g1_i1~~c53772_g1_i1.p1  ORF type:complete len:337 (+),score=63.74 c53772_g1_i1:105-1013(+)
MAALSAQAFRSLLPEEFHARFLERSVRSDGRMLLAFRPTSVQPSVVSSCCGSAIAKLGSTTVIVGVAAEIGMPAGELPRPENSAADDDEALRDMLNRRVGVQAPPPPQTGYVVVNADLPPLCSPAYAPGKPSVATQLLTRRLERLLTTHSIVDTAALVVSPGAAAWALYIDVIALDDDGNVFDAAVLAMMAALRAARLPVITMSAAGDATASVERTLALPLRPVSLHPSSFARLAGRMIADPSAAELRLCTGAVSVVLGHDGEVLDLEIGGEDALNEAELEACFGAARERAAVLAGIEAAIR